MNLPACCLDLEIELLQLIFPRNLDAAGWEFFQTHGMDRVPLIELQSRSIDLGGGRVRIAHRCAQLQDDGLCGIYDTRPQICRDFDCKTRIDCACKGAGFIAVGDLVFENDADTQPAYSS